LFYIFYNIPPLFPYPEPDKSSHHLPTSLSSIVVLYHEEYIPSTPISFK
jgi:hypothetical protein